MFRELQIAFPLIAGFSAIGWLTGHPGIGLLLGVIAYLAWHLYNLRNLDLAAEGGRQFPESKGLWDEVFRKLHRRQRKQRQRIRRLRKTIKRFEESSAALPDAVMMIDRWSNLEWCNQAGVDLLGIQIPRDVGQRITNLIRHPGFSRLFASEEIGQTEFEGPGAVRKTFSAQLVPYVGKRKLLIVRDISERLAVERMHHNFVANTSHELRTPLTVLRGYLEALQTDEDGLNGAWARPINQMVGQVRRMESIINDMLTLAKLESGGVGALPKVEIQVANLIDQIIVESRTIDLDKTLQIETNIDVGIRVLARENELRSAFANLIFNAVQYSPPGTRIDIEWVRDEDHLRFEVRDQGDGIAPEHIDRLTERFYRVDVAHSQAVGGTGLGLSIVQQIANLYGGSLSIESALGKGSTFKLEFPLSIEAQRKQNERPVAV